MLSLGISSCVISAKVHRKERLTINFSGLSRQQWACQTPNVVLIQKEVYPPINLYLHSGRAVNPHLKHINYNLIII